MQIASNSVTTPPADAPLKPGNMVQQIHKKAANLDALVENLDGYVWSVDTEMRYIILNSALLTFIKDVVGVEAKPGDKMLDILGLLDPSKTEEWKNIYQQAFEGAGRRFVSQFIIHGQPVFFEISINPMRKGDIISGISCWARDVTETINNSRKLQENETRFRSLIENGTDIIIVIDNTGNIVYGSPSIEKHFGMKLATLTGDSAFNYIYPEDLPELTEKFFEVLNSQGISIPVKSRAYTKDNRLIWVEGIVTNMLGTEGVNGIVCNFRDVTERKQAETLMQESEGLRHQLIEEKMSRQQEIMQAAIEAQEKERAHIGRELHDNVKQILSTAKICLEYGKGNEPLQQHMILRAEEMINTAITEIRELSKSLIQIYEREIGLQLSIENLVESIRIGNRFNISIDFSLPDENLLDDKLKMTLFRIIQEQLNNILTHAEAGHISISIQQQENTLSLCVSDDGKGFDVQQKRMGIGITNIINRAEIFNGQVDIDSAPGKGCRITVNFKI